MNPYLLGAIFGALTVMMLGCAASPDTLIMIDKSITITNPQREFDLDYSTESGVTSGAEFDGEVKPQTDLKITPR